MFAIPGCEAWTSSTVLLSMLCFHVYRQELCTRLLPLFADFDHLRSTVASSCNTCRTCQLRLCCRQELRTPLLFLSADCGWCTLPGDPAQLDELPCLQAEAAHATAVPLHSL